MTTPHDTPRWVYIGGKMVQAKPDAPDHDISPLYVLARDHAALVERCRAMDDANAALIRERTSMQQTHRANVERLTKERDEARTALESHTRAALASGGRGVMDDEYAVTARRWIETRTAKPPCPICNGQGWLHFACGTPWRCKCNKSSADTMLPARRTGQGCGE